MTVHQPPSSVAAALALPLLAATHAAAVACREWVGRGEPKTADQVACTALRDALSTAPGRGRVVIGEGVKDAAPMLAVGEQVGCGGGEPRWDLAVDPVEGTRACAEDGDGSVAVVAAAPAGTMLETPGWYMDKLVVGAGAADALDIDAPIERNADAVAQALGLDIRDLVVVVLDKPRHAELVIRLREHGCRLRLIRDGDVLGALQVSLGTADLLAGIGGAPEGVITAAAVRCLGGDMQGRLVPQSDEERRHLAAAGVTAGDALRLDDLVASTDCCVVATAITTSPILRAPRRRGAAWQTQSFLATPLHPGLIIDTCHPAHDPGHVPVREVIHA
jgi:fructose-1,6-bisphosphatase II